ncbi:MAG: bifunctional diaminohydroxyphosphoribosylaminopyrimidine deaminase/5-amino-6-(5-phosphoribosylamino)uracil reductase RibD [Gammaproteobacteria bacterium]|nr:bifunctional diaminohydroxyphosphoribosylaminopyrimidine deaminase/5-amino-6-(5-phosphoribosylamino)uracil reductase RibD [Gammaproteobacteria bacterium]MCP5424003.1 bifunctional diaminohydroxyphosphoribosylaminopyrimidine deaminase/5-amino-6-(5-phosphoribosylamino)uracil reductase RibD [Gammaproteobacteria bacterium]
MVDASDYHYMSRALILAERGLYTTDPNPRVGCVLVKDGQVIGEGWHVRAGEAHAEVIALEQAGEQARGATVYVTLEPCCHHGRTAPCTDALLAAGVTRVVAAMEDPNPRVAGRGLAQIRAAGVAVECGLLSDKAQALNPGFVQRMRKGRPWVRCKLAMSLDGRTAMASGESQWITGAAARADVQRLRARSSAIMTGIGTVLADDPSLTVRLPDTRRQPLRVILDSRLRTPPGANVLQQEGPVLIFTSVSEARYHDPLRRAGAEIAVLPPTGEGLDLAAVLAELAAREINELHLECGATLAGALLRRRLLDELIVYLAPLVLGDSARGLFHLPGMDRMDQRIELTITDIRAVGHDWRIDAQPAPPQPERGGSERER